MPLFLGSVSDEGLFGLWVRSFSFSFSFLNKNFKSFFKVEFLFFRRKKKLHLNRVIDYLRSAFRVYLNKLLKSDYEII